MNKFLIAFLLMISVGDLFAQNLEIKDLESFDPAFEKFELPGGPLGNSIQGILQDSIGFMWFASQAGLHRYDGRDFVTFNSDPNNPNTINSDYIEDIYLDSKGKIWLSHWSGGGLTSYDPDQGGFTRYIHDPNDQESILANETGEIIEDADGYIWIGARTGISRLDQKTGKFKRFYHDPEDPTTLSNQEVRGLYVDKDKVLWVSTGMPWQVDTLGGLNKYDPQSETFERFLHDPDDPSSITNNKVRAMFEDSKGNFWIGTGGDGLHTLDKSTGEFTHYPYVPGSSSQLSKPFLRTPDPASPPEFSHITSIYEDMSGRLWITAVGGGINVYDPKVGTSFHFEMSEEENEMKTNFAWQTFQSDDGTIWIATGGEGQEVYKIKQEKLIFPFFDTSSFNQDTMSIAHGIIKDKKGKIWIGQTLDEFTDNDVSTLWQIDRSEPAITHIPFAVSQEDPLRLAGFLGSISMDLSGNLWVGTSNGYFISDPENIDFRLFRPDFITRGNFGIPPVLEDSGGNIWIAHWDSGVFSYNPLTGKTENFDYDPSNSESISGPVVMSFFEDSRGDIWIGGGTPWFDPTFPLFLDRITPGSKNFEHFMSESVTNGVVFSITEDSNGNIWFLDFNESLFKLNPQNGQIKRFTPYNSLLPGGSLHSIEISRDGNLWIGADESIIQFDPEYETMSIYNELHGIKAAPNFFNASSISEDGELLFARSGGFHAFYPEDFFREIKDNLPDLRITGFHLLDDRIASGMIVSSEVLDKPIWRTSEIELESYENVFSFSVACFDFYEPEANQIQFMLEGYDRGWREDIRDGETPFYANVGPGEYTFRLRGANSLGVWNKEGISLKLIVYPPWYLTWWAYVLYALILIVGVFAVDRVQRRRLLIKERERTQLKELEQAREIEKAYNELKTTQKQLIHSEKMASLGELTAGIAHEIQNPLNFVNNFSDVNFELIDELKEELDKGNVKEAKSIADDIGDNEKKIVHHGKRAEEIVKSMLQHSRGSEGKKEPTDINTLADEYLRLAFHGMRAKDKSFNVSMNTELDPDLGKVEVIPQDIGRVILNLITNSFHAVNERKAANENGYEPRIMVRTRKVNGRIEIDVKDNGPGIPDNIKNKIFQPFFSTKGTGKGTGLGLSLSYDIITKGHGGSIEVESKVGEGTEFKIFLPEK